MHATGSPLPRVRALDGLRGLAVAGVLAYHCGFGWARGGFLGVSLFFTLSGFLITSLLLGESSSTGRISLASFWGRRARRLLPAAMIALTGIVVFGATIATGSQMRALRGDVLAALGYIANWRFIASGTSYASLWSSPSPVQHFWSLAIEEQLYVVLPLVVTGALLVSRGRRRLVALVLSGALAASALSTFLVHDQLRAYYGTDVRAAELLAGALLAVVVAARPSIGARWRPLGIVALVAIVWSWTVMTQTDDRLYHGGLLVHAALVVVVILAARGEGALASILSLRPLRWLGGISYGAYLYHWPIFLWLSPERTGLDGPVLAGLRVTVALVAAWASARLLEEPIRERRLLVRRAPFALAATAIAVAACVVVVTASPPEAEVALDPTQASGLIAPSPLPMAAPDAVPTTFTAPTTSIATLLAAAASTPTTMLRARGEPLRVYVMGDSNAFVLGLNLQKHWGPKHNARVWTSGWFACHIVPGGSYRWAMHPPKHTQQKCNDWSTIRATEIATIKPHIVLVIYGSFDLLDRQWDGSDTWTHVGLPEYDRLLDQNIAAMADMAGAGGARVVWATYPRTRTGVIDGVVPKHDYPEVAEYRIDRLNTLIREEVARRPFAEILELRRYMQTWPEGELDPVRRPDGIHPSDEEAVSLSAWIGNELQVIANRQQAG